MCHLQMLLLLLCFISLVVGVIVARMLTLDVTLLPIHHLPVH
jgi:tRNA A37 threonylcarbamoyltransferase TsaD